MDNFDGININKPEEIKNHGDDPEAIRQEELKGAKHKKDLAKQQNAFWLQILLRCLMFFIAIFAAVSILVIWPASEMRLGNNSFGELVKDYSQAFVSIFKTSIIVLITIIFKDALSRLYTYIREHLKGIV